MTAIAYRDGVLAADTGTFSGAEVPYHMRKIERLHSHLAASSGNISLMIRFHEWVRTGMREPFDRSDLNADEGFRGIVITPDGRPLIMFERGPLVALTAPFHALGACNAMLLGAMAAGASAAQAVEIAIRWSDSAAGGVQVEKLHDDEELAGIIGGPAIAA